MMCLMYVGIPLYAPFMVMIHKYFPLILFLTALVLAAVFHGVNMFAFPYFESDEGTYMSQAWAIVTEGRLSPYTYWYDHPPGGWIFIAAWTLLFTDGFFAFGSSIDTGRVLMLVVHIVSAGLIFHIVRHVSGRALPAFAASLFFSISPLAIYFQRRVLIDSIMIFWVLAAIAVLCIAFNRLRLRHYLISGAFFAFAVLTKLTAVFFGPAFLYLLWTHHSPLKRHFRITMWLMISGMIFSTFFLFALLSNELFPPQVGEASHVSFMGAVQFQAGRGGGSFWEPDSAFASAIRDWAAKDFLFTLLVLTILGSSFFMIPFFRNVRFFLISMIPYVFFLTSGGVNFNFYILPLIPIVVMTWALYIHNALIIFPRKVYTVLYSAILIATGFYYFQYAPHDHFVRDETKNQRNGIIWIKENLDNDTKVLIDNFAYVDLHDARYVNEKTFPNADWYYKISRDDAVGTKKYNKDWRNFEYVSLTHEMLKQIEEGNDPIIRQAFDYGYPYKKWIEDPFAFVDLPKMISTNGDWNMLYRVGDTNYEQLRDAWGVRKERSLEAYGQLVDPVTGTTTSQNQAHALLQAVMVNDEEIFKNTWLWTKNHIQYRVQDRLLSADWNDGAVEGNANDSGADADIAAALLLAAHVWEEPGYEKAALEIINNLWRHTIVPIGGTYYPLPSNKITSKRYPGRFLVKPSSFRPAWYKLFAEADPAHDWLQVHRDSYTILQRLTDQEWNQSGLPLDSFIADTATGAIESFEEYTETYVGSSDVVDVFSDDAAQVLWYVSLDASWYESDDAIDYLRRISRTFTSYSATDGRIPMAVTAEGEITPRSFSYAAAAGVVGMYGHTDPERAGTYHEATFGRTYAGEILPFNASVSSREESWAWLGHALHGGTFRNLRTQEF